MLKVDLRKTYLARQRALSAAKRIAKSGQISRIFFQCFVGERLEFLHIFLPIEKNGEIETRFIYEKIWRERPAVKIAVPKININSEEIANVSFTAKTRLALNRWQIPEPVEDNSIDPAQFDVAVVPLLSFDQKGFRVGYGKGFYDKFLAKCRTDCLKIGLSYFPPVGKISDTNPFDVPLDYCVTPEKMWDF